jgi:transcriptional regulator with XRE-family HTH domain
MKKKYKDKSYEELVKRFENEIIIFGENVKRMRVRKKLTQEALANECQIGLRTVQRIENGQMTVRFPIILAVAAALRVQVTTLFRDIYT